jgi:hypothetical protein
MANPPKLPPSVVNSDVAVGHVLGLECKAAFKAEKAGELFIHNYYSCEASVWLFCKKFLTWNF